MGATVHQETNGLWVVDVSGALRKQELDAVQASAIQVMGPHDEAKVLIMVADDFLGWVGGEVWGDMKFFIEHGDRIVKIAIVGDTKWESRMLMFAGAGFRRAPVKYFPGDQLAEARAWLG